MCVVLCVCVSVCVKGFVIGHVCMSKCPVVISCTDHNVVNGMGGSELIEEEMRGWSTQ